MASKSSTKSVSTPAPIPERNSRRPQGDKLTGEEGDGPVMFERRVFVEPRRLMRPRLDPRPKEEKFDMETFVNEIVNMDTIMRASSLEMHGQIRAKAEKVGRLNTEEFMEIFFEVRSNYQEALEEPHDAKEIENALQGLHDFELLAAFNSGGVQNVRKLHRQRIQDAYTATGFNRASSWLAQLRAGEVADKKVDLEGKVKESLRILTLDEELFGRKYRRMDDAFSGGKREREACDVEETRVDADTLLEDMALGKLSEERYSEIMHAAITLAERVTEQNIERIKRNIRVAAGYRFDDESVVIVDPGEDTMPDREDDLEDLFSGQKPPSKRVAPVSFRDRTSPLPNITRRTRLYESEGTESDEDEHHAEPRVIQRIPLDLGPIPRVTGNQRVEVEERQNVATTEKPFAELEDVDVAREEGRLEQIARSKASAIRAPQRGGRISGLARWVWGIITAESKKPMTHNGDIYVINEEYVNADGQRIPHSGAQKLEIERQFRDLKNAMADGAVESKTLKKLREETMHKAADYEAVAAYLAHAGTVIFRVASLTSMATAVADIISPNWVVEMLKRGTDLAEKQINETEGLIQEAEAFLRGEKTSVFTGDYDENLKKAREIVATRIEALSEKFAKDIATVSSISRIRLTELRPIIEKKLAEVRDDAAEESLNQAQTEQSVLREFLESMRNMDSLSDNALRVLLVKVAEYIKTPKAPEILGKIKDHLIGERDTLTQLKDVLTTAMPYTTKAPMAQGVSAFAERVAGPAAGDAIAMQMTGIQGVELTARAFATNAARAVSEGSLAALGTVGLALRNLWSEKWVLLRGLSMGLMLWENNVAGALASYFLRDIRDIEAFRVLFKLFPGSEKYIRPVITGTTWIAFSFLGGVAMSNAVFLLITAAWELLAVGAALTVTTVSVVFAYLLYKTRLNPFRLVMHVAIYYLKNPEQLLYLGLSANLMLWALMYWAPKVFDIKPVKNIDLPTVERPISTLLEDDPHTSFSTFVDDIMENPHAVFMLKGLASVPAVVSAASVIAYTGIQMLFGYFQAILTYG